MEKEIIQVLRKGRQLRQKLQRIEDVLSQLEPDESLILEILLDEENEKVVRICEELDVSFATGYRYIACVLERTKNILQENMVEIPREVLQDVP